MPDTSSPNLTDQIFRLMVESARDYAIFATDTQGRVTTWNAGAERLLGFREAEIVGQHVRVIFTPEDNEHGQAELEMKEALRTGKAEDRRWHLHKAGHRFWADGLMMPLRDDAEQVIGFLKIIRDRTAEKRAADEFARQAAESRVQAKLLELSHVFARDLEGRILCWNRGTQALYGWSKEEAIGQISHQLLKTRFPTPLAEITAQIEQEGRWQGELVHTCKNGRIVTVSSVWTQHDGEQGRLILEANTDITRRKELERSLRQQAQELEEADRRKNEFLAVLAHELRNPLAAIHSAVSLARMPEAEKYLPEALETINHQCDNLARLVDDLLDVSRIRQGKVKLEMRPVELTSILRRAADAVRPLIEQRKHELTLLPAAHPLRVEGDPTRLEQIIVNLLTNAAKYSGDGGQIIVSAVEEEAEAVIRVRDTGVGIPPDMLPKIFDLFTQVERSLARSEGGLGIGLTLVKRLVEMHGGGITATSEVGKGSEFTVRLPLHGSANRATAGSG